MSSRSCWFARYAICVRPFSKRRSEKGTANMVNRGLITAAQAKDRTASELTPRCRLQAGMICPICDPPDEPDGYFRLLDPTLCCRLPTPFWLGAAAIVLIFSFFGFLAS